MESAAPLRMLRIGAADWKSPPPCGATACARRAAQCSLAAPPFPSPPLEERARERRSSFSTATPATLAPKASGLLSGATALSTVMGLLSPALSSKGGEGETRDRWSRSLAGSTVRATAWPPSSPKKSTPLIRVWAVKGTNRACGSATSRPRRLNCCLASTTIERPSGVSSARDASCAASARRSGSTPGAGMNALAIRLPKVMVPVLSSNSTSTSPAASTARPLIASTLRCSTRSMPAMPMALSNPPMVVGIRHTNSEISTGTENATPE